MLANGYEIALTGGPLTKARYINPAIEKELADFKQEIAEKFAESKMNKTYVFPRPLKDEPSPVRNIKRVIKVPGSDDSWVSGQKQLERSKPTNE